MNPVASVRELRTASPAPQAQQLFGSAGVPHPQALQSAVRLGQHMHNSIPWYRSVVGAT
jgi:hypothetical protein